MSHTDTFQFIQDAWLSHVEALIAKHPRQEQNRDHLTAKFREAGLGKLTRRIRSKGGFTDLPKGTAVLWVDDRDPALPGDCRVIWAPGHKCEGTLVSRKSVKDVLFGG